MTASGDTPLGAPRPVAMPATPRPAPRWDVVIIGAGHNALVTATYLPKGGLRTLVLERRDRVGGAADTIELGPHLRIPALAHTVGRLRPTVHRDLDLKRHGLSLIGPDVRAFAPSPDGSAVVLWGDVARTAEGLRDRSAADADAYPGFDRLVRSMGKFLDELGRSAPPDIDAPGIGDAITGLKLGKAFRGLGKHDARTILRILPMAVADLVAETFESDAVRAAIAWRGVRYNAVGPWSAGTAAMLLMDSAGNDGGAAGETVFVRGGPGALSAALASALALPPRKLVRRDTVRSRDSSQVALRKPSSVRNRGSSKRSGCELCR